MILWNNAKNTMKEKTKEKTRDKNKIVLLIKSIRKTTVKIHWIFDKKERTSKLTGNINSITGKINGKRGRPREKPYFFPTELI